MGIWDVYNKRDGYSSDTMSRYDVLLDCHLDNHTHFLRQFFHVEMEHATI